MTDILLSVCRAVGLHLGGGKTEEGKQERRKRGEMEKKGRISCLVKAGDVAQ